MVRFEDVSFCHPSRTTGLKNINLKIDKGDFVIINGSTAEYKTTLLNLVYGCVIPKSGRIYVLDYTLPDNKGKIPEIRTHIGYIFHKLIFFENLTVKENLLVTLLVKSKDRDKRDVEEKVDNILRETHFLKPDTIVERLSSGEKQFLNVIRAIISEPLIILADEPLKHLNKEAMTIITKLLEEEHRKGVTIILTTNNLDIFSGNDKKLYTLKGGTLTHHGN